MSDNLSKYDLVIFDIDGTLLDTEKGLVDAAVEAIQTLGLPEVSRSDIRSCIGPPLAKTMVEKGYIKEEYFSIFNDRFRSLYKDKYLMEATVYHGVMDLLSVLKGKKKIAIATNKREDYTKILMDKFGISEYCDVIYGTDFDGKLKKYDLIKACLSDTHTSPNSAVMIGDTTSDRSAAEMVGVDFIAVNYGFGFKDRSENERSADSVDELIGLIL